MSDYNKERGARYNGSNRGGRNNFDGRRDSGRSDFFRAICSECGNSCEVPFKPTGDKPVYCNDCFRNIDSNRSSGRDFERKEFSRFRREERTRRDDFGERKMFKAICSECGNSCELPFQPTTDKPVYCSDCFSKNDRGSKVKKSDDYKLEFERMDKKLDMIIKFLGINDIKKENIKVKFAKGVIEDKIEENFEEKTKKSVKKPSSKKEKSIKKVIKKKK